MARAVGIATGLAWFLGADKGADDFVLHQERCFVGIDAFGGQESASVFHAVHTRYFEVYILETGSGEFLTVFGFL